MTNRALLSALALCFIAAGCDSQKPAASAQPRAAAAVTPLPPAAPQPPAASSRQDAPAQVAQADAPKANAAPADPAKTGNGRKGCTKGNCKVDIDVTGGKPCAKATPDKLDVYKGNQGDDIHWKVNTDKWKFTSKGIEWKDKRQQQFPAGSEGHENNNNKTYKWKDLNTDSIEYRYTIHLVNDDGTECVVDPSAINGADEAQEPQIR